MSDEKMSTPATIGSVFRIMAGLSVLWFGLMKIIDDTIVRVGIINFAENSLLFGWFFRIFAGSDTMMTTGVVLVVLTEIFLGVWLLSGFLARTSSIVNFAYFTFIFLSWIPQWSSLLPLVGFMILYGIPVLFRSDRWAPLEKFVPEKYMRFHI